MVRFLFILVCACTLAGCGLREREKQLEIGKAALVQKEQELALREKTVQLQEEALEARQKKLDSSLLTRQPTDSSITPDSSFAGNWSVRMNCTETTCSGSAVGDIKNEHWEISIQQNLVIARALAGRTLSRIYTGGFQGKVLTMTAQPEEAGQAPAATISVTLTANGASELRGQRIIARPDECRIVYALELTKQN